MIPPPNEAPAFPADYLVYVATLTCNRILPATELFTEPRDPAMALGRQGDENFRDSVLIGCRQDGLFMVLKYASRTNYSPKVWQYCIVGGAEWDVAMEYPSFSEMLHYLETETPHRPPVASPRGKPSPRQKPKHTP